MCSPCCSVGIGEFGFLVVMMIFFIVSAWDTIRPRSVRVCWSGLLWGKRMFPSIPFALGWPLETNWILEIG